MSNLHDKHGLLLPGGITPVDTISTETGASGDLAKKKTFPSLLHLYNDHLLPKDTKIWGFARSDLSDEDLRERIYPYLEEAGVPDNTVQDFLKMVVYQKGNSYGDEAAFESMAKAMTDFEQGQEKANRLFYFAIPPNAFADTAVAIKSKAMQDEGKGWTRLIVEKPFGRDSKSFEELNSTLAKHFTENHIYRIDHYLGKEMVQNLTVLRFSNTWFERVWNKENVQCIILTFKEPFGTEGRGGYFDKYGIIRDILQNHLLQVLTILCMEPPITLTGPTAGKAVRDAKVAVLNAISEIKLEDVVLGQYEGYADDPTIENKDTNTPTFAVIKLNINSPRWTKVPIFLKAGKALNERKAEMRIQFKDAPAADFLFGGQDCPRNELVMRMQPSEAVYIKTNVKSPGFEGKPIQSELEVNYDTRFFIHQKEANPDAYTRLILDVLQGKQSAFVRDDELRRAWEIFTPLLHRIESENVKPIIYPQGSRGPPEADQFVQKVGGYVRNEDYVFYDGTEEDEAAKSNAAPVSSVKPSIEYPEDELSDVGLFGMAVMGQNFALNMAQHGFKVCVGNRSYSKVETAVKRAKEEGNLPLVGAESPEDLVARLKKPRKVIILVQAGRPVDDTISTLARLMEPGDLIIDGGNEWFHNSIRRGKFLEPKNIHFIGMGISGGETGARNGPSLMPGGPKDAYELIEPILTKCAAQVEGSGPCVGYLGPIGSGNYVKMVHNGIEYGDMQLIAECYDVLKNVVGMSNDEMADLFDSWNTTELDSYLIEITSKILRKADDEGTEKYIVDAILDKTGSKGTGRMTVQDAAEKGVAIPTIAAALDARVLSSRKGERVSASKKIPGPVISQDFDKKQIIEDLRKALYASKVCSYAQGLSLIDAASTEHDWNVDLAECARLWKGGCIIRARMLSDIEKAFSDSGIPNLIVDDHFAKLLADYAPSWRRTVAFCVMNGIACPALSSALSYFDSYRRERLPANLTQAQRDFFGGHSIERVDKDGRFHVAWTDEHKDIGDANARTAGEK